MKQIASCAAIVAIVLVVGFTHTIAAQETEVEIKKGEVLRVLNNTVVVRVEGEGVKTFVVSPDFKFQHEGKEITVADLRPGNKLTGVRIRTAGGVTSVAEEDIDKIMAEVAEVPAEAAEAVAETADAAMQSEEDDGSSEDDEESAGAPAAAAAAAAESAETAEAAAAESGMSPGLMIGLLLLALVLVLLAVKQLRKA